MTDPGDYAYPVAEHGYDLIHSGLTKREYFAAMAMQGLLAGWHGDDSVVPLIAVKQADALIAELNKSA